MVSTSYGSYSTPPGSGSAGFSYLAFSFAERDGASIVRLIYRSLAITYQSACTDRVGARLIRVLPEETSRARGHAAPFFLCSRPAVEMAMLPDYPTDGWRFYAFVAGIVVVGLLGVFLMLLIGGHD
jgi:hypothetical protein